jgi:hypothetical protein
VFLSAHPCPPALTGVQLLITFSNLGNTWPRYFVLKGARPVGPLDRVLTSVQESICSPSSLAAYPPRLRRPPSHSLQAVRSVRHHRRAARADHAPCAARECASAAGQLACATRGGACAVAWDGFFVVQALCLLLGGLTVAFYIFPAARRLQGALDVYPWCLELMKPDRVADREVESCVGHVIVRRCIHMGNCKPTQMCPFSSA